MLVPPAVQPSDDRRMGPNTVAGIVDEAIGRSQRRQRRTAVFLAAFMAVTGAGIAALLVLKPRGAQREINSLVQQQVGADDTERARLQAKIDELTHRLGRGGEIAKENRDAVFLVVSRGAAGADGFCTAFAATKRRLLTNAHCVQLAEELAKRGSRIDIVGNGGGDPRPVLRWHKAHGFHASQTHIGTDVGWLEVGDDLPVRVRFAPQPALEALSAGEPMSTYGFPGRLADTMAPEATYVTGVIGRVTALDGRPGAPKDRTLLQHSAYTSAGTSGSPLFDSEGRVIGINAGGYMDAGTAGRALPGYNFGMRIDLAVALLEEADQ
jgi:S1-C subfamily serine protease